MSLHEGLAGLARRAFGPRKKQHRFHYEKLADRFRSRKRQPQPWQDVISMADLRPTDQVLDVGCAEGLIALEVAKYVAHVDGLEIEPIRVQEAKRIAGERGVSNVDFAVGSVVDAQYEPNSYDVILFLEVLGKPTDSGQVDLDDLAKLLRVTRRQIVVRIGLQKTLMAGVRGSISLAQILSKMDECGFDAICFARREGAFGNMIIGNRRGTDAKIKKAPPILLVPTEFQREHPCLRGVEVGAERDFL